MSPGLPPSSAKRARASAVVTTAIVSRCRRSTIGAGMPAGPDSENQDVLTRSKPCSRKVGTSGKEGWRSALLIAMARTLPWRICPAADGRLSDIIGTWPEITAVIAGPAPRKGTWVKSMLFCWQKRTISRWFDDPAPEDAMSSPPRRVRATRTMSARLLIPLSLFTTQTEGLVITIAMWLKLRTGS